MATLVLSSEAEARRTRAFGPKDLSKDSHATFNASGATNSSILATKTCVCALGCDSANDFKLDALATASSPRNFSANFCCSSKSFCIDFTRSGISSGLTFKLFVKVLTTCAFELTKSITAGPATASMRRMPLAIPDSLRILKPQISEVLETCVPPQSSMDTFGTSTTRTTSLYFSPNIIVAPFAFASAMGISATSKFVESKIHSLTKASISSNSFGFGPREELKSNRNRSKLTKEPAWETSSPMTCFNALCNKCVAVWLAFALRLESLSTFVSKTEVLATISPDSTRTRCEMMRPPAAF